MIVALAVALWAFHGMALWWNWGAFRPRVALLHGLGVALAGGGLIGLGAPVWLLYVAGAVIGAVGGWGHQLAPGLWVGVGLLWLLPAVAGRPEVLLGVGAFAVTAQLAAAMAALARSSW